MIPILVDLYGVLSLADVAIRFERAYARQLKGRIRARIEEFLQSTGLGLSLGALGISARLQLDPRTDPLPALHALLDLPLRLEESGGFRALIVLDEFQDITKVTEIDALLRSHIQFQGEVASFVFAGSEPGLMRELFEDQGAAALRPGGADAARATGRRRHRRRTSSSRFRESGPASASAEPARRRRARATRSGRCCSPTGSGRRSSRAATATLADWAARTRPRSPSSSRSSTRNWRRLSTNAQRRCGQWSGSRVAVPGRVLDQLELTKSTARAALTALAASATVEQRGRRLRRRRPAVRRVDRGAAGAC